MACAAAAEAGQLGFPELGAALTLPGRLFGKGLFLIESGRYRVIMHGSLALAKWDVEDRERERRAASFLLEEGLATQVELAEALGRHRNTMHRLSKRAWGKGGEARKKPGPKGPHKVDARVLALIAEGVAKGLGPTAIGATVQDRAGVTISPRHVKRLADHAGWSRPATEEPELGLGPTPLAEATAATAPADEEEKAAMAEVGGELALAEAPLTLPDGVRGHSLGAALYFPALRALGLLDVARACYRLPGSLEFDVRPVFLTLFFLTVLGRTRVQMAKHLMRWEFAALIGARRAPALRTLRRKLKELTGQGRAAELGRGLARHWVAASLVVAAVLYLDGHVKAYSGMREVQQAWSSKRKRALPALETWHVGDQRGRPLLFMAQPAGGPMSAIVPDIVAEVRQAAGDGDFTFTLVFDRGGYDSKLFIWLLGEGVGFITYQRGGVTLPRDRFKRHWTAFEGRRRHVWLAEDQVEVRGTGPWRRIVVLDRKTGRQVPILTSLSPEAAPAAKIFCLLAARWRQENFFLNAIRHVGLDDIASYAFEDVPRDRLVGNPERAKLEATLRALRKKLHKACADLAAALSKEPTNEGAARELAEAADGLEQELKCCLLERKEVPKQVPAGSLKRREQLNGEQKSILDCVKLTAYNAQEWMADRLLVHYPYPNDVRDLLRSFAQLDGQMSLDGGRLRVLLAAPDTRRHRLALRALCADLNALSSTYPGTDVPVIYAVAIHHSEPAR